MNEWISLFESIDYHNKNKIMYHELVIYLEQSESPIAKKRLIKKQPFPAKENELTTEVKFHC